MSGNKFRVLITGGTGNLGTWITRHLQARGYHVTGLASRPRWNACDEFIICDIRDETDIKKKLSPLRFDFVIHLAALTDTKLEGYAKQAHDVYVRGTKHLLQALDRGSLRNFIYFSTFHVYGSLSGEIDEKTPVAPKSDYAVTHELAEQEIRRHRKADRLPYTIFRLTNGYGAPLSIESADWNLLFNDLARSAFEKNEIRLSTNGRPLRDFIWIGDVCAVVEKLLDQKEAPSDTFNLSCGQSSRLLNVAIEVQRAYKEMYGREITIQVNEKDQTHYPLELIVQSDKLKRLLPYETGFHFFDEAGKIFQLLETDRS